MNLTFGVVFTGHGGISRFSVLPRYNREFATDVLNSPAKIFPQY